MRSGVLGVSLLLCGSALAAGEGYYHPDDVAAKSRRFAEAASSVGPAWEMAQSAASRTGKALTDLDLGVALLGEAAPAGVADRAKATRKASTAQFLSLQRHVDLIQEDYGQSFQAAMDRALRKVDKGGALVVCTQGGGLAGRFGPGGPGAASCAGDDMNGALASAIDADPELARALADIASVPWPALDLPSLTEAALPLTGDGAWIQAAPVARALIGELLITRQEQLEDALAPLEEGLEVSDADAIARAASLRADWERALAKDGAALRVELIAALARAEKRKTVPSGIGFCANPPALGGCVGSDVTDAVLPALLADAKLTKALARLRP